MSQQCELNSIKRNHVTIETESNHTSNEPFISSEDGVYSSEDLNREEISSEDDSVKSEKLVKNKGWAHSVTKILDTNKPRNKKTLVLSRAKKYSEVLKKEESNLSHKVDEENLQIKCKKKEPKITSKDDFKKTLNISTVRVKPNILEKDRERVLAKIATKGVVQLFNAVKNQQSEFRKEMNAQGLSESKKDKILKKFDKRMFLDTLMGQTKSVVVGQNKVFKDEAKEEIKPKWNVLRDNFMMGAKMKDWDKSSDEE